jgi:hypothetical protein
VNAVVGTDRRVLGFTGRELGYMAMKIYMLIMLLGAIAAFAHVSTLSQAAKRVRLG